MLPQMYCASYHAYIVTLIDTDLPKVIVAFRKISFGVKEQLWSRVTDTRVAIRFPCFPKTVFRGFVDVCSRPSQPPAVLTLTLLGSVKGSKHEA